MNLLYEQEKKIEELETENKQLKEQLSDRKIRISKVGSIAEASLSLSNIFKEAQKAADLYLENIQGIVRDKQTDKYVFPAKDAAKPPQPVKQEAPAKPVAPAKPAAPVKQNPPVKQPAPVKQDPPVKPAAPVKQEAPVRHGAHVKKDPATRTANTQVKPKQTVQPQKAAETKPAYVGRHSKGNDVSKK